MEVTETAAAGLKREFRVVVPKSDLAARVEVRLDDLKTKVQLRGFRPGKVPAAHLKRLYGKSAMAEVIEAAVREANDKIVTDLRPGERLAVEPKVVLPEEQAAVEGIIAGNADLAYTVEIEVVPAIALADFKTIKLTRPVADVTDEEVERTLNRFAEQSRPFLAKAEAAEKGDRVTVSYHGTIDGTPFEGGSAEDIPIDIGSGSFIPGFEDQIVGIRAGESRSFDITFPEKYAAAVAGKTATFAVTAKSVDTPGPVTIDDALAKTLGLESLAKLRDAIRDQVGRDHAAATRRKLKRALLDDLDAQHKFEPPPTLVEQEFANVWATVERDLKEQGRTFADEGTTEDAARAEYRAIAERRVRLGLVIAEIGEKNNIKVTDEQMRAAVMQQVRQVPGHEKEVWDYYRNNANALAALRAPLFEDKVVDFLVELADVTDKPVSREELFEENEE